MPKPQNATAEDLANATQALEDKISSVKSSLEKSAKDSEKKLKGEISGIDEKVKSTNDKLQEATDRLAEDLKAYADMKDEAAKEEVNKQFSATEDKIKACDASLTEQIQESNRQLRAAIADEISNLCDRFNKELEAVKGELQAADERWAKEAAEALVERSKTLDASIEKEQKASEARDDELKQSAQKEAQRVDGCLAEHKKTADELAKKLQEAQDELDQKIKKLNTVVQENREAASADSQEVQKLASNSLIDFQKQAHEKFNELHGETEAVRDVLNEVENLSTRRVDWVIRNASQALQPTSAANKPPQQCQSWFSPKFNAAGAHGLQLELQVFRNADNAQSDCAVFLWARKGTSMVYKLGVGSRMVQMEKVFNGKVPYGTKRLGSVEKHINKEEDTLSISLEVLEAIREVSEELAVGAAPVEAGEDEQHPPPKLEGAVVAKRHINNRLHDQVKKEVETMKARMVRRVDWRLEQAEVLPKRFPKGEALCSPPFNAAGIEGFQLLFYPSGYKGSNDGYCSLFLYGPPGVTLKASLYLGSQRRDIDHTFDSNGAFGRTNYCKFDAVVDEDNTILVAMEVNEALQEMKAASSHVAVQAGDRRTQTEIDGLPASDSVVKLQRVPGKPAAGLEEKRMLPSLWTTQQGDRGGTSDRLHTFDELRPSKPAPSPMPRNIPASPARSESLPALLPQQQSKDSSLQHMSRSTAGEGCLGDGLPRKNRGTSRRGRQSPARVTT